MNKAIKIPEQAYNTLKELNKLFKISITELINLGTRLLKEYFKDRKPID